MFNKYNEYSSEYYDAAENKFKAAHIAKSRGINVYKVEGNIMTYDGNRTINLYGVRAVRDKKGRLRKR